MSTQPPATGRTIAVQAFNKADSVIATLDSIAKCRGAQNYQLVIMQDGCVDANAGPGGRPMSARTPKPIQTWIASNRDRHVETTRAIRDWIASNRRCFAMISFNVAEENHGPYDTAERIINDALSKTSCVIFSEDDVIFEEDALEWFERALQHPAFARPDVWAIAGESKYFDARSDTPSPEEIERARALADREKLIDRFVYFGFVPSSCFATTTPKWAEFGKTRGQPKGDREVNLRCRDEGKKSIWPVVARCRDIGMYHPSGYSVYFRGPDHSGAKNSYILSGMFEAGSGDLSELEEGKNWLFDEFTRSVEA